MVAARYPNAPPRRPPPHRSHCALALPLRCAATPNAPPLSVGVVGSRTGGRAAARDEELASLMRAEDLQGLGDGPRSRKPVRWAWVHGMPSMQGRTRSGTFKSTETPVEALFLIT